MVWLFIAIILCMRVVQSACSKKNVNLLPKNALGYLKYVSFYMFLAACFATVLFIINVCTGGDKDLHFAETLPYALTAGVSLSVGCLCSLYNLTQGTMALNSLFSTAGLLIPTVASIFLYGETLEIWHWGAIITFMFGAFLLIGGSKKVYGKFSPKSLIFLLLLLTCEGTTMLMQKMFGMNVQGGNVSLFSVISFSSGVCVLLTAFAVLNLIYASKSKRGEVRSASTSDFTLLPLQKQDARLNKKVFLYAVFLACAVFVINQLATMSTPLISAVILFAFINGGATIISTIVGALMFKEKITVKTAFGLIIGIGSLILLKI